MIHDLAFSIFSSRKWAAIKQFVLNVAVEKVLNNFRASVISMVETQLSKYSWKPSFFGISLDNFRIISFVVKGFTPLSFLPP